MHPTRWVSFCGKVKTGLPERLISEQVMIVGGLATRIVDVQKRPWASVKWGGNLRRNFAEGAGAASDNNSVLICGGHYSTLAYDKYASVFPCR